MAGFFDNATRRQFLSTMAPIVAGISSPWLVGALPMASSLRLGCVTGAIKADLKQDWLGTLRRVAAIGYKELEFSDPIGPSDEDCKHALDELGLIAVSGGAGIPVLESKLPEIVQHSHVLGKQFVACYWPWYDGGQNKSQDDYRRLATTFNSLAGKLKQEGLRFVFHHHDLEFLPISGRLPCDLLLEETDPTLVSMVLDTFWIAQAGLEAASYLRTNGKRIAFLHLGDQLNSSERTVHCLGEGLLNFTPVLEQARQLKDLHIMIENPDATTGIACLASGYKQVRKLGF